MTPTDGKGKDSREDLRESMRSKLRSGEEGGGRPSSPAPPEGESRGKTGPDILRTNIAFGSPGLAQMSAFCRQLATLVEVGIPLLQSLRTLAERTEHPGLKKVVADVARRVESGESFAESLAVHPEVFSTLVVNVVRIGETGGILEKSLNHLADLMEKRYEIRRRVRSALAYPTVALIVCGVVLLIILGFAIPVFEEAYGEMPLPALTQWVLGISHFVAAAWWLIVLVFAVAFFGLRYLVHHTTEARRARDRVVLTLPLMAPLAVKVNVVRSCQTLANLLQSGVPLLEALSIAAETSENLMFGEVLAETMENLERGGRLVDPLRRTRLFPPLVVDMIAVGDEAGRLDVMFRKIAETYDSDVESSIRTLNAILEPALILFMGGIVLVLALAVLMPYWQLVGRFD